MAQAAVETPDNRACVLVADGGRARFFLVEGRGDKRWLREVEYFERPQLHVNKRDMTSDLTGRVFSFSAGRAGGRFVATPHGANSDFDPHAANVRRFAKKVARRLGEYADNGPLRDLILIAEPRFLGALRDSMTARTRARVSREVSRDYVHASVSRVQRTALARRVT